LTVINPKMFNHEPSRELAAAANTADAVPLFDLTCVSTSQRHDWVLRRCAWCQRIPVGLDVWVGIEEAMEILPFISQEMLGEATHGVCPDCFEAFLSRKQTARAG
jgi:hypothetical protein